MGADGVGWMGEGGIGWTVVEGWVDEGRRVTHAGLDGYMDTIATTNIRSSYIGASRHNNSTPPPFI